MTEFSPSGLIDERGQKILWYQMNESYFSLFPYGIQDKVPDIDGQIRLRDGKSKNLNLWLDYQLKSTQSLKNNKYIFSFSDIDYQLTANRHTIMLIVDIVTKKIYCVYFQYIKDKLSLEKTYKTKTIDLSDYEIDVTSKALKEKWEKIAKSGIPPMGEPSSSEITHDLDANLSGVTANAKSLLDFKINTKYQKELDDIRDLIIDNKPATSLRLLNALKDRVWDDADNKVKFRILTNIGASKLALELENEASEFFLQALNYNKDDEKALSNVSLAYLLIGKNKLASKYAKETLDKYPNNPQAISIYLQTGTQAQVRKFLKENRTLLSKSAEANFALGFVEQKRNNYKESLVYLRRSRELDSNKSLEILGTLAGVLIEKNVSTLKKLEIEGLKEKSNKDVSEAIEILDEIWNKVKNTELAKIKVGWLVNLSFGKRMLGDYESSYVDAKRAYEIDQNNFKVIRNFAVLSFEMEKNDEAIEILDKYKNSSDFPEASYLLAILERERKNFDKSISLLEEQLKQPKIDAKNKEDGQNLLIETYLMAGKDSEALEFVKKAIKNDKKNISLYLLKARVLEKSHQKEKAIIEVKKSLNYLDDESPYTDRFMVAGKLYQLQEFKLAQDIYENLLDKSIYTKMLYRLLYCYFATNDYAKALALSRSITAKNGGIKDVLKIQATILEEQGDLNALEETFNIILSVYPNDSSTKIEMGYLLFRRDEFLELDKYLDELKVDVKKLSMTNRYRLAYLYSIRKKKIEFLETMYETRRDFYEDSEAHIEYARLFFMRTMGEEERDLLDFGEVENDTTVFYKFDNEKVDNFTIDDRENPSIIRKEIAPDDKLAKKLLGKKVGDKVQLPGEINVEIIEIKSKYVHALHESLALQQSLFNNSLKLQSIQLGKSSKGQLPEGFEKIQKRISDQYAHTKNVEKLYKSGKLTVGSFANLIGKNIIEVWGGMVAEEKLGLKCSGGNLQERVDSVLELKNEPQLIADIIALMTIHALDIKDSLVNSYGKIGVAQSTIDELNNQKLTLEPIKEKGYLSLSQNDLSQMTKHEVTPKAIKKNIDFLTKLISWIRENCEVLPVQNLENIDKDKKDELEKMFGISSTDTLLISREPKRILFSDDYILRVIGKNEFGLKGIWTQALLMNSLSKGYIDQKDYDENILKLVGLNYHYIGIGGSQLLLSLEKAEWKIEEPFLTVLNLLKLTTSDTNSAVTVLVDFLYDFYLQKLIKISPKVVIFQALDVIMEGRNFEDVFKILTKKLKLKFFLMHNDAEDILKIVEEWVLQKK